MIDKKWNWKETQPQRSPSKPTERMAWDRAASEFAIKVKNRISEETAEAEPKASSQKKARVVVKEVDMRRNLTAIKESLLEKLTVAAVPTEALDKARQFLETVVRDVTLAAQGLTRDALHRIKTHLVDLLPSLSPAVTTRMVDEAEKEAGQEDQDQDCGTVTNSGPRMEEGREHDHQHPQKQCINGLRSNSKPQSRL